MRGIELEPIKSTLNQCLVRQRRTTVLSDSEWVDEKEYWLHERELAEKHVTVMRAAWKAFEYRLIIRTTTVAESVVEVR